MYMHQNPIQPFLWYLGREFLSPINYVIAALVGVIILVGQGNSPFASIVPYLTPIVVQALSKSTVKYRSRYDTLLLQLPAQRPDPTFVIDAVGTILASAGNTRAVADRHELRHVPDFVLDSERSAIDEGLRRKEPFEQTCYSDLLRGWYEIRFVPVHGGAAWLVWFQDVTTRVENEERLRRFRSASTKLLRDRETIRSLDDLDTHIAETIITDGFRSVFIVRDVGDTLRGRVFKRRDGELLRSEVIHIDAASPAPVTLSRKHHDVIIGSRLPEESTIDFEARYPFNAAVKEFVGEEIDNFATYHHDRLSIVFFNRVRGVSQDDREVFESILNTFAIFDSCVSV